MKGTNHNNTRLVGDQPQSIAHAYEFYLPTVPPFTDVMRDGYYAFLHGAIKYALVNRGGTYVRGWVLCYADGYPITYADANEPGSITVSASGSYMTL